MLEFATFSFFSFFWVFLIFLVFYFCQFFLSFLGFLVFFKFYCLKGNGSKFVPNPPEHKHMPRDASSSVRERAAALHAKRGILNTLQTERRTTEHEKGTDRWFIPLQRAKALLKRAVLRARTLHPKTRCKHKLSRKQKLSFFDIADLGVWAEMELENGPYSGVAYEYAGRLCDAVIEFCGKRLKMPFIRVQDSKQNGGHAGKGGFLFGPVNMETDSCPPGTVVGFIHSRMDPNEPSMCRNQAWFNHITAETGQFIGGVFNTWQQAGDQAINAKIVYFYKSEDDLKIGAVVLVRDVKHGEEIIVDYQGGAEVEPDVQIVAEAGSESEDGSSGDQALAGSANAVGSL